MSQPYAYDMPQFPRPAREHNVSHSEHTATSLHSADNRHNGHTTRPGLGGRRASKNVFEADHDSEIMVLKKRLGSKTPNNVLASKFPKESMKRIDMVLVHSNISSDEEVKAKKKVSLQKAEVTRTKFESALLAEGLELQSDVIGELKYTKIHSPFWRLAKEAEKVKLEMPLEGCQIYEDSKPICSCLTDLADKYLVTDDEVDFVSASFQMDKLHIFENHEKPDVFFRPALRCFLTHHILLNIDIRDKNNKEREEDPMSKKGLPYMLHKNIYEDAYILHDETFDDPMEKAEIEEKRAQFGSQVDIENPDELPNSGSLLLPDTRKELDNTWPKFFKFQPLWKIRNYFGEKIALYFAWSGTLITTLWIPTLFGLAVFFYGLYKSISSNDGETQADNATAIDKAIYYVDNSMNIVKESFDNNITPYFALVICLWGTIFLEVWKRKNATLAYEWDVDDFEDTEPDRPQFIGTHVKPDPIIPDEETWYYPLYKQAMKYLTSFSMLLVMVMLVFIAVASVILYRVIMTVDYCEDLSSVGCLLVSTIISSLLNAVAILVLGKLYDLIALKLTDWENHRTQTQYDDALIIKLFAFQFANSYSSLFYIAFFRGTVYTEGIFGLGAEYQDSCGTDNNCMAMLSFQVLVLMLVKPMPKFLKDIILPWLRMKWRRRKWCRKAKIDFTEKVIIQEYLEREQLKPDPGDFTLSEYTEKVIVYGFLMLFAASFPLAPFLAILINLIDIRVDAKRMIWMYRRPVLRIAQDIGMWYGILEFLNVVGVVSNGFLIAFTSSWGKQFDYSGKLWVVIGFEHIVFAIKYTMAGLIPDVPSRVRLRKRKEKYQVAKILDEAAQMSVSPVAAARQAAINLQNPAHGPIAEEEEEHDMSKLITRRRHKKKSKKSSPEKDYRPEDVRSDREDTGKYQGSARHDMHADLSRTNDQPLSSARDAYHADEGRYDIGSGQVDLAALAYATASVRHQPPSLHHGSGPPSTHHGSGSHTTTHRVTLSMPDANSTNTSSQAAFVGVGDINSPVTGTGSVTVDAKEKSTFG